MCSYYRTRPHLAWHKQWLKETCLLSPKAANALRKMAAAEQKVAETTKKMNKKVATATPSANIPATPSVGTSLPATSFTSGRTATHLGTAAQPLTAATKPVIAVAAETVARPAPKQASKRAAKRAKHAAQQAAIAAIKPAAKAEPVKPTVKSVIAPMTQAAQGEAKLAVPNVPTATLPPPPPPSRTGTGRTTPVTGTTTTQRSNATTMTMTTTTTTTETMTLVQQQAQLQQLLLQSVPARPTK